MRQHWEIDDLIESWTLDPADLGIVRNKTGATRLGFAVLLKFFELEARFPSSAEEVPIEVVDFVARQLGVGFDALAAYDWSGRSWKRHRAQVRARFGFRGWNDSDIESLVEGLVAGIDGDWRTRDQLLADARSWCRAALIEPPSAAQMDRFVGSALSRWEERACARITARLSVEVRSRLNYLFDDTGRTDLAELRSDPGAVSVDTVLAATPVVAMHVCDRDERWYPKDREQ